MKAFSGVLLVFGLLFAWSCHLVPQFVELLASLLESLLNNSPVLSDLI